MPVCSVVWIISSPKQTGTDYYRTPETDSLHGGDVKTLYDTFLFILTSLPEWLLCE